METKLSNIVEKFSAHLCLQRGSIQTLLSGINSPELAKADHLIFIADLEHLKAARGTLAQTWIVHESLLTMCEPQTPTVLLTSKEPLLVMAWVGRTFFGQRLNKTAFQEQGVDPRAAIHPTAKLGLNVLIGPHTTIGANVTIGDDCIIGANVTIEAQCQIGARTHIHPQVYVAYDTRLGEDCEIHPQTSLGTEGFGYAHDTRGRHYRQTHYGRLVIGNRVHIGAGVQVDRGTFADSQIDDDVIIDNHCHFGHNIKIGQGTVITGGLIAAGSVTIGKYCVFGGRTSIAGHLKIADHCHFAGLSGITKDVPKSGKYGGYPLQSVNEHLRTTANLAHLTRLRKSVAQLFKHLGLKES